MRLTGYQVKQINEFMGGDYDVDVTIERSETPVPGNDGEERPAGLYIWCSDYPEEGSMHLPEFDPDTIGDATDYPSAAPTLMVG